MEINPRSLLFPHFRLYLRFLLLIILLISPASSAYGDWFLNCNDSLQCDSIPRKEFPLWRNSGPEVCGGNYESMKLECDGGRATIEIVGANYELLGFSINDQILILAEIGFSDRFCPTGKNISSSSIYAMIPVSYYCGHPQTPDKPTCSGTEFRYMPFEKTNGKFPDEYCWLSAVVPISQWLLKEVGDDWQKVALHIIAEFKSGRTVDGQVCSKCNDPGAFYVYDFQLNQTRCCCQSSNCFSSPVTESPKTALPSDESRKSNKKKATSLIVGVSIGGACLVATIIGCCIFFCFRKKKKQYPIGSVSKEAGPSPPVSDPISNKDLPPAPLLNSFQSQSIPSYPSSKSDLETPTTNHDIQVFNYAELEKATDNFNRSRESYR